MPVIVRGITFCVQPAVLTEMFANGVFEMVFLVEAGYGEGSSIHAVVVAHVDGDDPLILDQ